MHSYFWNRVYIYYSKYYKGQCLVLCSSENCMGVSNIHIFCPLTNWYCKITSNSTWFWHEIRILILKFGTLRPKRNAIFTENDPISEASGWQSSAIHSKNCIAHESSIFPEYSSTIAGHLWPSFGRIFYHAPMTTTEKASWPPWLLDAFSVVKAVSRFFDDGVGHSKSPATFWQRHTYLLPCQSPASVSITQSSSRGHG